MFFRFPFFILCLVCLQLSCIFAMADAEGVSPMTPGGESVRSSAAAWAVPGTMDSDSSLDIFKRQVQAGLKRLAEQYHSPGKYLEAVLRDPLDVNKFAEHLWSYYPEQDDTSYHHKKRMEPTSEKDWSHTLPTCLHLVSFGFEKGCSLKPFPGTEIWMLLTDQYLADGFCSNSEPLLVVQSVQVSHPSWKVFWNDTDPMPSFSLGYVKGMARMSSLFALLHFCWVEGLKVKECHPVLYESVLRIWAHHVEHVNKVDEALHTMKMSSKGSIRKAVNVIQAAVMIQNLFAYGLTDFGAFVRKWNQSAARAFQITGKRATSLKYLFEQTPKD
jgi:hypothetical protein